MIWALNHNFDTVFMRYSALMTTLEDVLAARTACVGTERMLFGLITFFYQNSADTDYEYIVSWICKVFTVIVSMYRQVDFYSLLYRVSGNINSFIVSGTRRGGDQC